MESTSSTRPPETKAGNAFGTGIQILDNAYELLLEGRVGDAVTSLVISSDSIRKQLSKPDWETFAKEIVPAHPLCKLIHQDPFTFHSFSKPRGYSGDADLLDLIYQRQNLPQYSELGKAIYEHTYASPACQSVRMRKRLLASMIDALAVEIDRPRVLSVACGHLREAQESLAVREGLVGEFIALDQDAASLAVVEREQSAFGITPVNASIRALLTGRVDISDFDFIYSAGLYDYLAPETATRLTTTLFSMLKPGGKLLVANFTPDLINIGYMETVMNWWLLYRTEHEMEALASEISPSQVAQKRMFRDRLQNVIYLELVKS